MHSKLYIYTHCTACICTCRNHRFVWSTLTLCWWVVIWLQVSIVRQKWRSRLLFRQNLLPWVSDKQTHTAAQMHVRCVWRVHCFHSPHVYIVHPPKKAKYRNIEDIVTTLKADPLSMYLSLNMLHLRSAWFLIRGEKDCTRSSAVPHETECNHSLGVHCEHSWAKSAYTLCSAHENVNEVSYPRPTLARPSRPGDIFAEVVAVL